MLDEEMGPAAFDEFLDAAATFNSMKEDSIHNCYIKKMVARSFFNELATEQLYECIKDGPPPFALQVNGHKGAQGALRQPGLHRPRQRLGAMAIHPGLLHRRHPRGGNLHLQEGAMQEGLLRLGQQGGEEAGQHRAHRLRRARRAGGGHPVRDSLDR